MTNQVFMGFDVVELVFNGVKLIEKLTKSRSLSDHKI